MSKYIDADLYVEMQIYDDEHEEWGLWNGAIEDLLNQWTEQGCPTPIEVSEDCISRAWVLDKLDEQYKVNRFEEHNDGANIGISQAERIVVDAPSVLPTTEQSSKVGEWISQEQGAFYPIECSICHKQPLFNEDEEYEYTKYCPNCGAKMKGVDNGTVESESE